MSDYATLEKRPVVAAKNHVCEFCTGTRGGDALNYQKRIEKGMALLDERLPGWEQKINLEILSLESGCDCVLGQLALDLGTQHDPEEDPDEKFIETATMLWPLHSKYGDEQEHAAKMAREFGFNADHYWEMPELTTAWVGAIGRRLQA